jgi:hypothetical protein
MSRNISGILLVSSGITLVCHDRPQTATSKPAAGMEARREHSLEDAGTPVEQQLPPQMAGAGAYVWMSLGAHVLHVFINSMGIID